jgi:hypothetical protein
VLSCSHTIENFAPTVVFVNVTLVTSAVIAPGSNLTGDFDDTLANENVGVALKVLVGAVIFGNTPAGAPPPPDCTHADPDHVQIA